MPEKRERPSQKLTVAVGIVTTTLSSIECGQVNPTWATVRGSAAALGVSVAELAKAAEGHCFCRNRLPTLGRCQVATNRDPVRPTSVGHLDRSYRHQPLQAIGDRRWGELPLEDPDQVGRNQRSLDPKQRLDHRHLYRVGRAPPVVSSDYGHCMSATKRSAACVGSTIWSPFR